MACRAPDFGARPATPVRSQDQTILALQTARRCSLRAALWESGERIPSVRNFLASRRRYPDPTTVACSSTRPAQPDALFTAMALPMGGWHGLTWTAPPAT